MKNIKKTPNSPYAPRYWPVWLGAGVLWLIIQLPRRVQFILGKYMGLFALKFGHRERQIAEINLSKCFPEKTKVQRDKIMRDSFIAMGQGMLETAFGWWANPKRLKNLARIQGLEHIENALNQKRSVILCTPHLSTIHLSGIFVSQHHQYAAMYLPPKNPALEKIITSALKKHYYAAISRDNVRLLIKCLKKNIPIVYTPDTDAGLKNSIFAPFFGINTATLTATSRFAKLSGCAVVFGNCIPHKNNKGYDLIISPPLDNFPSDDDYADACRINRLIEEAIRENPGNYLWQYKRFKTRPAGEERFYPRR
jgi:KDO2-lipid IV(A) lauroyltransferase